LFTIVTACYATLGTAFFLIIAFVYASMGFGGWFQLSGDFWFLQRLEELDDRSVEPFAPRKYERIFNQEV